MRTAATNLAAFALGSLLAVAGSWVIGDAAPAPSASSQEEQAHAIPPWVRPDCPEEVADGSRLDDLTHQLEEKRQQLSAAWAREENYTGKALEWPQDVEPRFEEEAVATFLEASTARTGGTILGIDCGEYPCVATIAWKDSKDAGAGMDDLSKTYPGGHGGTGTKGRAYVQSRAFGPDVESTPDELQRLGFRVRESMELFPIPADWKREE